MNTAPTQLQRDLDAGFPDLPVLTWATNPRNPDPADYERAAKAPIPERGHRPTPDWFEFEEERGRWRCSYPHPDPTVLMGALYVADAVSHGLEHLNEHHPGWKLPCARCGKPQWNTEGRPTCFDCRR